jgi:hypothetical protein
MRSPIKPLGQIGPQCPQSLTSYKILSFSSIPPNSTNYTPTGTFIAQGSPDAKCLRLALIQHPPHSPQTISLMKINGQRTTGFPINSSVPPGGFYLQTLRPTPTEGSAMVPHQVPFEVPLGVFTLRFPPLQLHSEAPL